MNTLFDNEKLFGEIDKKMQQIKQFREDSLFEKDFSRRFCWSSNAIEGNTLSLDETVSLIVLTKCRRGILIRNIRKRKICIVQLRRCFFHLRKEKSQKTG